MSDCSTSGYFVRLRVNRPLCPRYDAGADALEFALSKQQAFELNHRLVEALINDTEQEECPNG